jgi:Rps23 Pro-64 3,4-dihydroxylase Tpa1-like proline 4-hydroxylase
MREINIDFTRLYQIAEANRENYASGNPFPHIYLDNLFDADILEDVIKEFPSADGIDWVKFNNPNERKLASRDELQFGAFTRSFIHVLNSKPFLVFLEKLTGIENLIPDPSLEGGGLHQILPGGLLKVHADFNKHYHTKLDRRLNVLIYLNKDWEESYGGFFELWDKDMKEAVVKILPIFNRMALFSTTSTSYHGHPDALNCPPDRSRKSIALYYYTNGRPKEEVLEGLEAHTTIFKSRANTNEVVDFATVPSPLKTVLKKVIPPIFFDIKRKLSGK